MEDITVVVTVLNEEKSISALLDGLDAQTCSSFQVVIVDGGSTDNTVKILNAFYPRSFSLTVLQQKGNRSIGRNAGVKKARTTWIAFTDAGCVPRKNWLEKLLGASHREKTRIVAGYYSAIHTKTWHPIASRFMLVSPDNLSAFTRKHHPDRFLPATRSMLIERSVFLQLGMFDESANTSEDYAFSRRIPLSMPIAFAPLAIVDWFPPSSLRRFFKQLFTFAYMDAQLGVVRTQTIVKSFGVLILMCLFFWKGVYVLPLLLMYFFYTYLRHKSIVHSLVDLMMLLCMQWVTDLGVLFATCLGSVRRIWDRRVI
ncbi:MAG: hypothetical protein UX04_C0001G0149 [Microgenomates group bacterium GW2011_GWF2_45_18]|nr:MAG: hypothetical protein UW18_C0003G0081 [Microgenomates group bacterium GW2011_GWF1_44_10]KKU02378.1 MAG: hypothetical protein UX04_C0001G0149 [Microgenomates group bacterium GW2011_GWF2_45_18]OGJ41709.1 MAG: hypothetical protein A2378_02400 [Candidatus Pacebacteria bacterium RIFOXYB1_FULL_44_10]HAU99155.1 hypothetical protein [Candidatus Paceibacterota bacterium]HAX01685.1 hypothetical protein [Candidatus Paceibacterota bacterium]